MGLSSSTSRLSQLFCGVLVMVLINCGLEVNADFMQLVQGVIGLNSTADVAMSLDGKAFVVGAPNEAMVYAFVQSKAGPTEWQSEGVKIAGVYGPNAQLGSKVAISGDGKTFLAVAMSPNEGIGEAYVLVRALEQEDGSFQWALQAKLHKYGMGRSQFGTSVALSANGDTALIGAPFAEPMNGTAIVFVRSGCAHTWTEQGLPLGRIDDGSGPGFGHSVSLSADGNRAVIGAPSNNTIGAAWVFYRTEGNWIQQGPKLVGTYKSPSSSQGKSVTISGDGNTIALGGTTTNEFGTLGVVWIFKYNGTAWNEQAGPLIPTDYVNGSILSFGSSISLNHNGTKLFASAPTDDNNNGAAWSFISDGGVWVQEGSKLVGTRSVQGGFQGKAVGMSDDGNFAISIGDRGGAIRYWVFAESSLGLTAVPTPQPTLAPTKPTKRPSQTPSKKPTKATRAPSNKPSSLAPTKRPTKETHAPTHKPSSFAPTKKTKAPTSI